MTDSNASSAKAGRKATLIGVFVNAFLILLKFIAGIFGDSQALIADAVHSISDLFTDAVVLLGIKIGRKPPDKEHHFGHARIETLASQRNEPSCILPSQIPRYWTSEWIFFM